MTPELEAIKQRDVARLDWLFTHEDIEIIWWTVDRSGMNPKSVSLNDRQSIDAARGGQEAVTYGSDEHVESLRRELAEAQFVSSQLQLTLDKLAAEEKTTGAQLKVIREQERRELVEWRERAERAEAELKRIAEDKDYLFAANVGNEWNERLQVQQRAIEMRDELIATLTAERGSLTERVKLLEYINYQAAIESYAADAKKMSAERDLAVQQLQIASDQSDMAWRGLVNTLREALERAGCLCDRGYTCNNCNALASTSAGANMNVAATALEQWRVKCGHMEERVSQLEAENAHLTNMSVDFDEARERITQLESALTKLWKHTPKIGNGYGNGYCMVCRRGRRSFDPRANVVGKCSDADCLSYVVEAALSPDGKPAEGQA